jgi:hypothetical protein
MGVNETQPGEVIWAGMSMKNPNRSSQDLRFIYYSVRFLLFNYHLFTIIYHL